MIDKCKDCEYFTAQEDMHGEIVLTYCGHSDNKSKYEGNTNEKDCPLGNKMKSTFDNYWYVYRDSHGKWNTASNPMFIAEHTMCRAIPKTLGKSYLKRILNGEVHP